MANPLRVLHVHSGNLYGGVETMMLALVRQRDLRPEVETAFALCFNGRLSRELEAGGADVFYLGETQIRNLLSVRRARKSLSDLLRRHCFDVVATHSCWSQAIFGRVVRAAGLPLVNFMHGPAQGRHWLERWAKRTPPDAVIANSRFTAGTVKHLFPQTPFEVIYPLVTFKQQKPANVRRQLRQAFGIAENTTVIIQVSRMEALKGHSLHLQALSKLRHLADWECWMVGDAQRPEEFGYAEGLKSQAENLGVAERLRFLGERADISELLAAADIFCQPNIAPEAFGITFVEALIAGLPVVTTAIGGAIEIVGDSCGVLVPPGDAKEVAKALRLLITDKKQRIQLGSQGPARARQICDSSDQMLKLYEVLAEVNRKSDADFRLPHSASSVTAL